MRLGDLLGPLLEPGGIVVVLRDCHGEQSLGGRGGASAEPLRVQAKQAALIEKGVRLTHVRGPVQHADVTGPKLGAFNEIVKRPSVGLVQPTLGLGHESPASFLFRILNPILDAATVATVPEGSAANAIFEVEPVLVHPAGVPPPLAKVAPVMFIVQMPSRCLAFQMVQDTLGFVEDPESEIPCPKTEIDVLETIAVALVEATQPLEDGALDEHAGGGYAADLPWTVDEGIVSRELLVYGVGHAVKPTDDRARMLDGPVGVQQLATDDCDLRLTLDRLDHGVEPSRERNRIVVQKHQVLTRGRPRALIARRREPDVQIATNDPKCRPLLSQKCRGPVRRRVIDDDDLGGTKIGGLPQLRQALFCQIDPIVYRDDDRATHETPQCVCHVSLNRPRKFEVKSS